MYKLRAILIITLIFLLFVSSTLAMTDAEFAKVKNGDVVLIDLSKYNAKSITGKVIDLSPEWAVVYEVRPDDSWTAGRWNKYYITSIVSSSGGGDSSAEVLMLRQDNAKLRQENVLLKQEIADLHRGLTELKAKLNSLANQILELVRW